MPRKRTYTDDQLRAAIAGATTWADVLVQLGRGRRQNATWLKVQAARLNIDVSHFDYVRTKTPVTALTTSFSRPRSPGRRAGLSAAATWFLERGYNVSIPLEPASYDLVTESDTGLKRVQVKTTSYRESSGRFVVHLRRKSYDPNATANASGKSRRICYSPDEIDMFFIRTSTDDTYLIPIEVVGGLAAIVLDEKYKAFRS